MGIKIIADSACDITKELKKKIGLSLVPLSISVDGKEIMDDGNLDPKEILRMMKKSASGPKTSCPSPEDFLKEYQGDESVFVVTISSQLSGSYQSAVLAKMAELEKKRQKFIHVFDSLSASVGEMLVSLKIFELAKQNLAELEIVEKVNAYIKEMKTLFMLDSLDHLIKSGRINKLLGLLASALSMKPIMGGSEEGTIKLMEKVRGSKRAFERLVEMIGEVGGKLDEKILGIAHCNCLKKAEQLKEEVLKRYSFKDVIIVEMGGAITTYADEGGIVIAF